MERNKFRQVLNVNAFDLMAMYKICFKVTLKMGIKVHASDSS